MEKRKLLIVEDDENTSLEMKNYFLFLYETRLAKTLSAAREILSEFSPDVAILDLILPDGNGLELLTSGSLGCPTVILTTMDADEDRIGGLDAGAKDYLVKPVSMRVLAKHVSIRLLLTEESVLICGKLAINTAKRTVSYDTVSIALTSMEFNILVYLFTESDRYHQAAEIYAAVYGDLFLQSTAIKRHLSNLRYKLSLAAPGEHFILTQYGKGYRFCKEAAL